MRLAGVPKAAQVKLCLVSEAALVVFRQGARSIANRSRNNRFEFVDNGSVARLDNSFNGAGITFLASIRDYLAEQATKATPDPVAQEELVPVMLRGRTASPATAGGFPPKL